MKKVKLLLTMAVIVFAAMICCSLSAFALTEGDWEFQLHDNEVTVTKYVGEGGKAVIPETIYGCPVTKLEGGVFQYTNAEEIEILAKITEIPRSFAEKAWNLKKITIPEGVTTIGSYAFSNSAGLETVILPSTLKTIDGRCFESCKNLKNINLPEGLESIYSYAFLGSGVEEITIPGTLKNAGEAIFWRCPSLKKVVISEGNSFVYTTMFRECHALNEVELASTITTLCGGAFEGCSSLTEIVLPTSLKKIENNVFYGCSLTELIIPNGVEEISTITFDNEAIKSIFIPDSVTTVNGIIDSNRCPNAIVYCGDNSKAAEFCKSHKISYLTDSSVNSGIHVLYNGKRISFHSYAQNPEILEGRTLVPLRSIFEAMGADVEWDGATNTAIAKRGKVEVRITIGANGIYKNGKAIPVDVPAMLLNSRTMVPARVIAEAFGADVDWNGNGRIVLITE